MNSCTTGVWNKPVKDKSGGDGLYRFGLSIYSKLALIVVLLFVFIVDISAGSVRIPLSQVFTIIFGGTPEKASWLKIVLLFRLPKAITAGLAGAGLAVGGLYMQTLFRNPLAGPSILGIGAGASLGVAIVVLSLAGGAASRFLEGIGFLGDLGIVVAASIGSGLVLVLVLAVSRRVQSVVTLLILGMLFGFAVNAVVNILIHFSVSERIHAYISWTFGTFGGTTWSQMKIFVPAVSAGLALAFFGTKPMDALLLGEAYARSMGVRVQRTRTFIIIVTALLTGSVTAFCGPIAFLGVAVPHLCRYMFQASEHKILLPASALVGAILALISDLISQLPGSQSVLPLNSVTALIGTPVIVWIILKQQKASETFIT
jgi:iron complex transport system permease protein